MAGTALGSSMGPNEAGRWQAGLTLLLRGSGVSKLAYYYSTSAHRYRQLRTTKDSTIAAHRTGSMVWT